MNYVAERWLEQLSQLDGNQLDKAIELIDQIRNKAQELRDKFNEGRSIIKKKAKKEFDLSDTLKRIRHRINRIHCENSRDFVYHMDMLISKLNGKLQNLAKNGVISYDECDTITANIESWINTNKPFSMAIIKKKFDMILTKIIDTFDLEEDIFD
jgi:predicted nuclease with TOPRIM domain